MLLALGGLDGSPRVGARNWKRLPNGSTCARSCWTRATGRRTATSCARGLGGGGADGQVHIVAESMGALAALGMALARPERVASLVLCNSAPSYARAPVSRITGLLPRLPTRVYETLAPVVTPIMGRPGWTAALGREGLAAA